MNVFDSFLFVLLFCLFWGVFLLLLLSWIHCISLPRLASNLFVAKITLNIWSSCPYLWVLRLGHQHVQFTWCWSWTQGHLNASKSFYQLSYQQACWILIGFKLKKFFFFILCSPIILLYAHQEKDLGKGHLNVHTNLPKKMLLNVKPKCLC